MRRILLLLALCALAACRSESGPEPEPAKAFVAPEPDCPLRTELEDATRAHDPLVRRAAARVLGNRGPGSSLEVVGELLGDPGEFVANVAIEALGEMKMRGGDHRARVAELLTGAVRGGSSDTRYSALVGLGACGEAAAGQLDTLRACFPDESPDTPIMAAYAWGEIGRSDELEAHVVELLERYAGGGYDQLLSQLLGSLTAWRPEGALGKLLASQNALVRFRAECAKARIEGGKAPWSEEAALEERWNAENREAEEALKRASWRRVPREELLARAGRARLVLSGELHESDGPIRDNQRALLRAFVQQPAFEAVGFEPSVEEAQSGILELARSLGLWTIPLETNWRELGPQYRYGARELETLAAITAFLGENPKNRMFVLRGESHVLPGGYLVRRLGVKPLVILSGCIVNVPLCAGGLRCDGSAYEVGTSGDVYTLPYDEEIANENAALDRWLAEHAAQAR